MCGIAGLVAMGAPHELDAAGLRMVRSQAHRGPDDGGLVTLPLGASGARVVLGSRRLAVLDPSPVGHQPMSNDEGTVWVVHNGEIYNFRALREQLEARGYRFRSNTDTEVILHAYEAYGDECIQHFRGMFAFAIWDAKAQRLMLARDRLGEKPLYVAWNGTRLLFASEVRAILASGLVERQLNDAALDGYLTFGALPGSVTMIDGIEALSPGHVLSLQDGRLQIRRYWNLAFDEDHSLTTQAAIVEQLRQRLLEAVRLQLISDVPLGAFLSGGIDSSSIVALMREAGVSRLRTFSLAFEQPELNEGPYARMIAARYETEHTEHVMTAAEVREAFDIVVAGMDQPSIDGFNTYYVAKLTRASGTVVALSGLGGDELFGGYSTFWWVPRLCGLSTALRWIPGGRAACSAMLGRSDNGRIQKLHAFLQREPSAEAAYLTAKGLFAEEARGALLAGQGIGRDGFDALTYLRGIGNGSVGAVRNRVSHLELSAYMHNQLLRDADVMSMAHGLEVRVPFLDHTVVEFVSTIPATLKFQATPKALLLQAMGDRLPPAIASRPKTGFAFPFEHWMRGEWRPMIEGRLLDATSHGPVLFDRNGVAALWRRFLAGQVRWSHVWAVLVLQAWVEHHVAAAPSDHVSIESPLAGHIA